MFCRATCLLSLAVALFISVLDISAGPPRKQQSIGNVLAWGYNAYGQLGNGTTTDSYTPVQVPNLPGMLAIAGGHLHSLAVRSDGTVWAWGSNGYGQLGNGTITGSDTPVQVINASGTPLSSVIAIAAYDHSLALMSDGTLWAWGANSYGQLGNGSTTNSSTPVQVSGLSGVVAIAAGAYHSLALRSDGTVWAWGHDASGQLGTGSTSDSVTPVQVSTLTGVVAIAAGAYDSAALMSDGTVWTWGTDGVPGESGTTTNTAPVAVTGLSGVSAVAAGFAHFLALESDGTVWAWGDDETGELGNGTTSLIPTNTPVQVSNLSGVEAIAGSGYSSFALRSDGTVWAWGDNGDGHLGNNTTTGSTTPVEVINASSTPLSGVVAISGGYGHALALQSQANAESWGYNSDAELGNGTTTNSSTPIPVSNLTGLVAVSAGKDSTGAHGLALRSDGTVWAWGNNSAGQLGNGTTTNSSTPVQVSNLTGVVAIAAGVDHSLALRSDGTVWAWGFNYAGQLGNGTTTDSDTPVQVSTSTGLTGVIAIAAGYNHSLAVKNDGTVWAWGNNIAGQLGNGTTTNSSTPAQVLDVSGVAISGAVAVAGGNAHSLVLKNDGTVWAWGDNSYGELGNGTGVGSTTPVQVSDLAGMSAISAGLIQSLAGRSDGTVWAWGENEYGQLGNGTTTNSSTPVEAVDGTGTAVSGMVAVAAGTLHSLALRSDGTVWAWGYNGDGELGNGTTTNSNTPVQVSNLSGVAAIMAGGLFSVALNLPVVAGQAPVITSANSAAYQIGQTASFTVTTTGSPTPSLTESGALPSGLTFVDNGNGSGTLSGTVATGTVGSYNIIFTAQNGVTPNAVQSFTLTVTQANTITTLTASPNPANSGQSVTLTAAVTVVAPGSGAPTGTVTFSDGGTALACGGGSQTLAAGQTTCQYTFSAAGTHALTATYSGDANFISSSGGTSLTVNSAAPPPPVQVVDDETITVTDTESFPDVFDFETVHVTDAEFITPLINVTAPVADFSTGALGFNGQSGSQTITASDIGLAPLTLASVTISGSSQFTIMQIACSNGASSPSTILPSGGACSLMISYVASSVPANDNATVTFTDNAALSNLPTMASGANYTQSVPLSGAGTGTPPPPPPPATVPVLDNETIHVADTESFPDVFDAEKVTVTDTVTVTVLPSLVSTEIAIYGVPRTIDYPGPITLRARILSADGAIVSGGTVQFSVAQVSRGCPLSVAPALVSSGVAASRPLSICAGTYSLTATYSGNGTFAGSMTTSATPLRVRQLATTTTLQAPATASPGSPVVFTATVTAILRRDTPTGTVTFLMGENILGSAPLSNGVATFTDSSLPTGEDSITASYGGDTNFEGSSSAAVDILVENVQVLNGITYIYPIDYPGASQTDVWGINNSGTLVGFYRDATGTHGFSGSLGSLTPINVSFPTASSTEAFGINDAGTIVGRYLDGAAEHGFKDAGGIFTSIDFPVTLSFLTQNSTDAFGINNSGNIVGVYTDATGTRHGFLDQNGNLTTVAVGTATSSTVNFGINDRGAIVSTFADVSFGIHGYVNKGGSAGTINAPGASLTDASGIDNAGDTVGFYVDSAGSTHGFVDQGGGNFTRIDVPGALSTRVFGINNSSRIVGIYTDAIGTHGFEAIVPLAVLVPATQISATASGLRLLSRATGIVSGTITIQNISRSTVNGPFQILLEQLSGDVQLVNASGTFDGFPYITVAGVNSLAPGQSATVGVQFSDPSRVAISFTPLVYSGNF
jgi:probable HAF family extracellular repeat protein